MIVPIKLSDEDFDKIKVRTADLIKFWSNWGYTDVSDMPQYMQDIIKLIGHVEAIVKDETHGNKVQEPLPVVISAEKPASPTPTGSVADTSSGIK